MFITAPTLDDLLRAVFQRLLSKTTWISPSKGPNTELTGIVLQITRPRARLSRSELKGTVFSCLGELLWYLSGSNRLAFISHYIKAYPKFSDDGKTLHGAYGPRLFAMRGVNQIDSVIALLKKKPSSRQAVIQLFDASDITRPHKDVPCTCVLQFMIRGGKLHLFTYMRSNDAYLGLPHDVFAFTMIQELVARSLARPIGSYNHLVGSLHLYRIHRSNARAYLSEGWQSTIEMPAMPAGDQWGHVQQLIEIEKAIRLRKTSRPATAALPRYWRDIASLLDIHNLAKAGALDKARSRARQIAPLYRAYVEDRLNLASNGTVKAKGKR